jgi:predicted CoA-binding protein
MRMATPPLEIIEDFLAQKRISMIGVSRNPKDFSAALFEELRKRGYEVIPINPKSSASAAFPGSKMSSLPSIQPC